MKKGKSMDQIDKRIVEAADAEPPPSAAPSVEKVLARGNTLRRRQIGLRISVAGATIASLAAVAGFINLPGNGPSRASVIQASGNPSEYRNEKYGYSIQVPEGWMVSNSPLATELVEPKEILALTNFDAPVGGECGPETASRSIPPDGVLIWLTEHRLTGPAAVDAKEFKPRPSFNDTSEANRYPGCFSGPAYGASFSDAGRFFTVYVKAGEAATENLQKANEALRSLRFEPEP
jgi:hypothetical protein